MNFSQAVKSALIDNYSTFKGRSLQGRMVVFSVIYSNCFYSS